MSSRVGGVAYDMPFLDTKLLQLPPPLPDDELALKLPKRVPAVSFHIRLVLLGVGDPGEDLIREDLLAEGVNLGSFLVGYGRRDEYWMRVTFALRGVFMGVEEGDRHVRL